MNFTQDTEAQAGYLTLKDAKVAQTVEYSKNVILDLDKDGEVVGIEVLDLSAAPAATA